MKEIRAQSEKIRNYILKNLNFDSIVKKTAEHFNISRQAVHKHLNILINEQLITSSGISRNKIYRLSPIVSETKTYNISSLGEDIVWRNDIKPLLDKLPKNVLDIWNYGLTEMLNNAIDHSEGSEVIVTIIKTAINTQMFVHDNGIGIFKKIKESCQLEDERQAILELTKGKLTTDPDNHSGEGIFFTSRVFDKYNIISGNVNFSHEFNDEKDWLLDIDYKKGTLISMEINNHSSRKLKDIFDKYTAGDEEYGFNKTVVPVRLAQYGNDLLVSRSQAKRLLARVDKFKIVVFDFLDIDSIGQAFADEIFRVFALHHPEIELIPIHTTKAVSQMINRAQSSLGEL